MTSLPALPISNKKAKKAEILDAVQSMLQCIPFLEPLKDKKRFHKGIEDLQLFRSEKGVAFARKNGHGAVQVKVFFFDKILWYFS
jgi:hypothetical protein